MKVKRHDVELRSQTMLFKRERNGYKQACRKHIRARGPLSHVFLATTSFSGCNIWPQKFGRRAISCKNC